MDKAKQTFQRIERECSKGGYGTWKIEIVAHAGKVVGFNEIEKFKEKFRAEDSPKGGIEDAV